MTEPIAASNLSYNKLHLPPKQGVVVCPPSQFYKYSVYDELDLGRDRYKELLSSLKKTPLDTKKRKARSFVNKLVNVILFTTAAVLIYKNKTMVKKAVSDVYSKIRNLFKK